MLTGSFARTPGTFPAICATWREWREFATRSGRRRRRSTFLPPCSAFFPPTDPPRRNCCATATSTRCATSRPISRPFPPPSILTNSRSKTDPKMTPSKRAGIPPPRGRRKLPAAFPPSSDRKNRGSRNTRKTAGVARNRGSFPANPDGDPRGKCGGRRSAGRRSVGRKSRGTRRGDCTSRSSGGGRVPRGD